MVLFAGDGRLLNTYAVVHPQGHQGANAFAEWLTRAEGRQRIETYRLEGRVAFTPWPVECPEPAPY